jgi:uncharacterized SAM-binding protein YcdF (DUF218 family)
MHHRRRSCEAAIGLGSRDLGVATFAARLYHAGMFPIVVFSGANSPSTVERLPRGEAVHYSERALELGVPASAIITEPAATNTGENITRSRDALHKAGIHPASVLLISLPYMERRAYATCRRAWPEVEAICSSQPLTFDEYVTEIGDAKLLIDVLRTSGIPIFAARCPWTSFRKWEPAGQSRRRDPDKDADQRRIVAAWAADRGASGRAYAHETR